MTKETETRIPLFVLVDSDLRRLSRQGTYTLRNVSTNGKSAFRSPKFSQILSYLVGINEKRLDVSN